MKSHLLICAFLLLAFSPAFAAEIPFDKAEEFPARAYNLIAEKRVVWLGEMHGSQEGPQLFLGLVRLVSRQQASPPVVALEIPTTEQRALDRYLTTGDDEVLRASPFFSSEVSRACGTSRLTRRSVCAFPHRSCLPTCGRANRSRS